MSFNGLMQNSKAKSGRGQVAIAFVVLISFILVVVKWLLPYGITTQYRISAWNAADAGALAAGSWLASGQNEASMTAFKMEEAADIMEARFFPGITVQHPYCPPWQLSELAGYYLWNSLLHPFAGTGHEACFWTDFQDNVFWNQFDPLRLKNNCGPIPYFYSVAHAALVGSWNMGRGEYAVAAFNNALGAEGCLGQFGGTLADDAYKMVFDYIYATNKTIGGECTAGSNRFTYNYELTDYPAFSFKLLMKNYEGSLPYKQYVFAYLKERVDTWECRCHDDVVGCGVSYYGTCWETHAPPCNAGECEITEEDCDECSHCHILCACGDNSLGACKNISEVSGTYHWAGNTAGTKYRAGLWRSEYYGDSCIPAADKLPDKPLMRKSGGGNKEWWDVDVSKLIPSEYQFTSSSCGNYGRCSELPYPVPDPNWLKNPHRAEVCQGTYDADGGPTIIDDVPDSENALCELPEDRTLDSGFSSIPIVADKTDLNGWGGTTRVRALHSVTPTGSSVPSYTFTGGARVSVTTTKAKAQDAKTQIESVD